MAMIPFGNVDTEAGGSGQPFPPTAGGGNVMSDTAPINNALGYGRTWTPAAPQADPMQYYFSLGQQLLQQQAAMQQQLAPQQQGMGGGDSFDLGGSEMLTAGFDPTWLTQRLDAASANGAAIGGIGKNPGGGPVTRSGANNRNLPVGGTAAGWDAQTVPSYSGMMGANRLM